MRSMARTILIVDDHAGFRTSARKLLEADGFVVVGEAANGGEAVALTQELRPAVVLLDVQLPDTDGFDVAERLAALAEPPEVILTSSRDSADYGSLIGTAAARAFVAKAELSTETVRAALGC
jgi:DNA-binding NarL/FixJ family response regulator